MRTLEVLRSPELLSIYVDALLAGVPVVLMCALLSVLAVIKRLGFVGQGVSHSAFGGVGIAAVLMGLGWLPESQQWGPVAQFAVIVTFCLAAAWGIGMVSRRRSLPVDTAIGVFLTASMALGAILVQVGRGVAQSHGRVGLVQSWESILFGSMLGAGSGDAWLAWAMGVGVIGSLWWWRRPLQFWTLDEESAKAFGISSSGMRFLVMTVLAVAIVTAMRLMGVILATALLVLPGAIAMRMSTRLTRVLVIAMIAGVVGLLGGTVLSIETDWPAGPSVVAVLTAIFAAASAIPARVAAQRRSL
jgi:ABC-type Mn2+/Zn2+ transport system permease subunit